MLTLFRKEINRRIDEDTLHVTTYLRTESEHIRFKSAYLLSFDIHFEQKQ